MSNSPELKIPFPFLKLIYRVSRMRTKHTNITVVNGGKLSDKRYEELIYEATQALIKK